MKLKKLLNKIWAPDGVTVGICDEDNLDRVYYFLVCSLDREVKYFTIVDREIRIVLKKDLKNENI